MGNTVQDGNEISKPECMMSLCPPFQSFFFCWIGGGYWDVFVSPIPDPVFCWIIGGCYDVFRALLFQLFFVEFMKTEMMYIKFTFDIEMYSQFDMVDMDSQLGLSLHNIL